MGGFSPPSPPLARPLYVLPSIGRDITCGNSRAKHLENKLHSFVLARATSFHSLVGASFFNGFILGKMMGDNEDYEKNVR